MKIDHTAYQVADPVSGARWYITYLGMTLKRSQSESPFMHFVADEGDTVMLEFYNNPTIDVRLLAAGAAREGEVTISPAGDELAMLRDPWGLPIHILKRKGADDLMVLGPRRLLHARTRQRAMLCWAP